jgi:hypothetical protein
MQIITFFTTGGAHTPIVIDALIHAVRAIFGI